MNMAVYLSSALAAIRLNAMRSMLTALGVIIGVASVIVMSAIGSGARQEVEKSISRLGTNMLTVSPGSRRSGRSRHSEPAVARGYGRPVAARPQRYSDYGKLVSQCNAGLRQPELGNLRYRDK